MEKGKQLPKHFYVELDLKRSVSNTDFEVVEGDTDNYVHIILTDDSEPVTLDGHRVMAVFSHSKGAYFQDSNDAKGNVAIDGNEITVRLATGSFKRGIVECELRILGETPLKVSTTPTFNFTCRPPLITEKSIASDFQISALSNLLTQVDSAISRANIAVDLANELPRLQIVYCDENPLTAQNPTLTQTPSQYMGFGYFSGKNTPSNAKEYSWFDKSGNAYITEGDVNTDCELTFTLSNGTQLAPITLEPVLDSLKQQIKFYKNVVFTRDMFVTDETYTQFPYRATVALPKVNETMSGTVVFSLEDATSGKFAPIAKLSANGITIYSRETPQTDVTVPLIRVEEAGFIRDNQVAQEML